jgi:hypothetical protein
MEGRLGNTALNDSSVKRQLLKIISLCRKTKAEDILQDIIPTTAP